MVNTKVALLLYSSDHKKAIELFIKFNNESNKDQCLDYYDPKRLDDNDVLEIIVQIGLENVNELHNMNIQMRNEYICKLKLIEGISIRQLSRIIGISKSVIDRI